MRKDWNSIRSLLSRLQQPRFMIPFVRTGASKRLACSRSHSFVDHQNRMGMEIDSFRLHPLFHNLVFFSGRMLGAFRPVSMLMNRQQFLPSFSLAVHLLFYVLSKGCRSISCCGVVDEIIGAFTTFFQNVDEFLLQWIGGGGHHLQSFLRKQVSPSWWDCRCTHQDACNPFFFCREVSGGAEVFYHPLPLLHSFSESLP